MKPSPFESSKLESLPQKRIVSIYEHTDEGRLADQWEVLIYDADNRRLTHRIQFAKAELGAVLTHMTLDAQALVVLGVHR